jgi:hypothetical protein
LVCVESGVIIIVVQYLVYNIVLVCSAGVIEVVCVASIG